MNRSISALLAGIALLAAVACTGTLPTPPRSPASPSFAGFDTWRYPGDDHMRTWRQASPYQWVGYYLPAPCHRDTSFSGRRRFLTDTGWGIAVIYVGQQTFDGQQPAEVTESTLCSSALLTAEQGRRDAMDAIAKTAAEGFPPGSVIYLDIERMERVTPAMVTYYQAWIRGVLSDGRYRPGTYAHVANAAALYNVAQTLQQQSGITASIPFWIAGGRGFTLSSAPQDVGAIYARIWQGVLDVTRTWGGRSLLTDENVATSRSPSAPGS
jgi:hypothetical protein